jgi:hypothetical protein
MPSAQQQRRPPSHEEVDYWRNQAQQAQEQAQQQAPAPAPAPAASIADAGKSFMQMAAPWAVIGVLCYVFPVLSLFKLFGMIVCIPMAIIGCAIYGSVGMIVGAKNGMSNLVSGATDAVKNRVGLGKPQEAHAQPQHQQPPHQR